MVTRHRSIIVLAITGIALFILIQGYIIPGNQAKEEQYQREQQSPITHDLGSILKYKNKYMGNASNLINLFQHLPLQSISKTFELDSDKLTLKVLYSKPASSVQEIELNRALLYNSLAAFALVDNLEAIEFHFADGTYTSTRAATKEAFGEQLSDLLTEEKWKAIQEQLKDDSYISKQTNIIMQK
ncbi:DUF4825 domain-containing protein [Brevibacillus reuszeri]|uniref:DUF4825 domain-containing protein n=1 Tax=Brevibacillus reuszeri TaxID=54915 RepID=UPI002896AA16|nr:DUF4825 domain-containing protein [Brevibacillus reuszeri]